MNTLSLDQFYRGARERAGKNTNERYCQAVFNHLYEVRPDLAEKVRGTDMDPFYQTVQDPVWYRFVAFIQANW